jgi:azurin
MKKVYFFSPMAMAIAFGLLVSSCNNSTTTNTSNKPTDSTGQKKTDTTANKPAATAPASKIVNGPNVELHAVGNTMTDMHFDATEIHVKAGDKVEISLTNDGTDAAMVHNVVIVKPENADTVATLGLQAGMKKNFVPDSKMVIAGSALANPGKKVEVKFKAPEKGEYLFICTYPGHYKIMRGKFIVE